MNEIAVLRPDFEGTRRSRRDTRSKEQILAHYLLERRLAKRLLQAPRGDRPAVYGEVYSELFRSLPDHPQNKKRAGNDCGPQWHPLEPLLSGKDSFLEIGCGDGALSFLAARTTKNVFAADVTSELIDLAVKPSNVRFLKTDGIHFDIPEGTIDVAYSNQLIEHLHPDDAVAQLQEVHRVLKTGGIYRITTPSRLTGPHDISVYFDWEASGFHLREYDGRLLASMLKSAGFAKVSFRISLRGREFILPGRLLQTIEWTIASLPQRLRARMARSRAVQILTGLVVHAAK